MSIGLTSIVTSVIEILFRWAKDGEVPKKADQHPTYLLVDCSNGLDRHLRSLAEQSMDDFLRRIERFPVILMALRLLDHSVRYDRKLKKLNIRKVPYATEWLNLLGDILHNRRQEAQAIHYDLERRSYELADRLEEEYPDVAHILRNETGEANPVWRLAEGLTQLQGRKNTLANVIELLDSALHINRPNGLGVKRATVRREARGGTGRRRELRSAVLTDSAIDYLVHRHLLKVGNKSNHRPLPLGALVDIIQERYGLCIDTEPPGMTISNELLQANYAALERRLRDLGLLIGVNDAEAMKRLVPRFKLTTGEGNEVD